MSLAQQVDDWLLKKALKTPQVEKLFEALCLRLSGIGIPIARARLNWPTLHPLFRAEMVRWHRDEPTATLDRFQHRDINSEDWQKSPLRYMLEAKLPVFRRRLVGPGRLVDFPILEDLVAEGYTDYVVFSTAFSQPGTFIDMASTGILVIWASDRESGFTEGDIEVLQAIQLTFALACKTIIQAQITTNIVETYLGRQAGRSVLDGNIRLGDGRSTKALVWYSDLRNSTHLTAHLPSDAFLSLLNAYFECAARPAITAGGEVLAFIGDAVLVIFPVEDDSMLEDIAKTVLAATRESLTLAVTTNEERAEQGLEPIRFGIGLNIGTVVFGNIGVPERLAFTVIGSTVTEVERIEKLTKSVGKSVLATVDVASLLPGRWRSVGTHALAGVANEMELFTPIESGDEPD